MDMIYYKNDIDHSQFQLLESLLEFGVGVWLRHHGLHCKKQPIPPV